MFKPTHAFSGFSVNNIEEAKKFYGETLGLATNQDTMGLEIKLPGGASVFVYPKADHVPATFTVLNFEVSDIDAAVTELTAQDIHFEMYDGTHQDEKGIARGRAVGQGPDIAWFKDPAGNILSVLQQ